VRELINYSAALQVEVLAASVKLWSTWFDTMAWYGWEVSQSAARVMIDDSVSADAEIATLVASARKKLREFESLPEKIAKDFPQKVQRRITR
jgi:hypothetical protein